MDQHQSGNTESHGGSGRGQRPTSGTDQGPDHHLERIHSAVERSQEAQQQGRQQLEQLKQGVSEFQRGPELSAERTQNQPEPSFHDPDVQQEFLQWSMERDRNHLQQLQQQKPKRERSR